ncbi:MAG TPA: hypothetical protein DCM40_15625 [Maribacter sp.]|nr:hypothetical protein [Maribacter sp.]|tara:strand:- start:10360 stop:10917 length:558 start_codon:yes stop_codon:yes gene_type:complete
MVVKTHNPTDIDILSRPIPGQSLTDTAGEKPYEKPPSIVSPRQAFDLVSESLEEPAAYQNIVSLLDAGISAETLASAVTLKMFSEGVFTPDIAEIIKPPLTARITDIGVEEGIEDLRVVNEIPDEDIDPENDLEMMQRINPEKFGQKLRATVEEEEIQDMLLNLENPNEGMQEPSRESFLDMEVQ